MREMMVCLNGPRQFGEHPQLPLTPEEIGRAAAAAVSAGAEAVHVHPRCRHGEESLAGRDIGAAMTAVRAEAPGTPVGVSTGIWIVEGRVEARQAAVAAWARLDPDARPDFASVNVGEPGFADLVDVLHSADIDVEAGVWTPHDADTLGTCRVHRVLVEIVTGPAATAVERADAVIGRLDKAGSTAPRLLHGEDEACWPLIEHAGRLGVPTRIGLEDTVFDDRGQLAWDNADLVRRALRVWREAGTG